MSKIDMLFHLCNRCLFEDNWVLGSVLGAEGTMTNEDKPLHSWKFIVWAGVGKTDIKQTIYVGIVVSDVLNVVSDTRENYRLFSKCRR